MGQYKVTTDQGTYMVTTEDSGQDWKGVVGQATKEAMGLPGSRSLKMAYDPVTQAKAAPPLMSAVGGILGGPMGATKFGEGTRLLSDAALASYGKKEEIPSLGSHALELLGNVLGDVVAFPQIKKAYYGGQIGKAESKFPGINDVVKEAPPSGPRPAVKIAQNLAGKDMGPLEAKKFQPVIDNIYKKGYPFQSALKQYSPDFQKASSAVSAGLNKIPGRAVPAEAMKEAMKVPNFVRDNIQTVWQNPVLRRLIYATLTGLGIGEGANLTFRK
jgi:hypothetical protein